MGQGRHRSRADDHAPAERYRNEGWGQSDRAWRQSLAGHGHRGAARGQRRRGRLRARAHRVARRRAAARLGDDRPGPVRVRPDAGPARPGLQDHRTDGRAHHDARRAATGRRWRRSAARSAAWCCPASRFRSEPGRRSWPRRLSRTRRRMRRPPRLRCAGTGRDPAGASRDPARSPGSPCLPGAGPSRPAIIGAGNAAPGDRSGRQGRPRCVAIDRASSCARVDSEMRAESVGWCGHD